MVFLTLPQASTLLQEKSDVRLQHFDFCIIFSHLVLETSKVSSHQIAPICTHLQSCTHLYPLAPTLLRALSHQNLRILQKSKCWYFWLQMELEHVLRCVVHPRNPVRTPGALPAVPDDARGNIPWISQNIPKIHTQV